MRLHGAGQAILYYRDHYNVSQYQVCEGICSIPTLSRMEMDAREVDSHVSETLIGRLGKSANRFEFVMNDYDYYQYELRYEMEKALEDNDLEQLKSAMERYKKNMPKRQILSRQLYNYYLAKYMQATDQPEDEIRNLLWEAIKYTRADFKSNRPEKMLFSPIEIKIIYNLYLYEKFEEENLNNVFGFVEECCDQFEKEKSLVPFYYNMALSQEKEENYEGVYRIAEKAIDIVTEGRRYLHMEKFYWLKIQAAEKIYHSTDVWEEKRLELIEECLNLYYIYSIDDKVNEMHEVISFCKEKLQCQNIEQEIL